MQCNIGKTDRIVRIVAGLCMIAAGVYWQSWWGVIGLVPLATAGLRFCPLYLPLGISTDKPSV
ncbi:MAG TPA: DUF2892 domain-containing protein [Pseudomonadales bacterium]